MRKQAKLNLADTNLANFGTDLEYEIKRAASRHETAWKGLGESALLRVWRIEKFQVVEWKQIGTFYRGDSFIVLHSTRKKESRFEQQKSDKLSHDIFFWLGSETTQDEAGTAAYKTVELDDYLGGHSGGSVSQHREVEGFESSAFLKLFKPAMRVLAGGIESGFNHVTAVEYRPRLLQVKGALHVRISQVELSNHVFTQDDVFIVDAGLDIHQWNGLHSDPRERLRAARYCKALVDQREGRPKLLVHEGSDAAEDMWKLVPGGRPSQIPDNGQHDDTTWEKLGERSRRLYRYTINPKGSPDLELVAEGMNIKRTLFESTDAYVFDTESEILVWIGSRASAEQRRRGLQIGQEYLRHFNRPLETSICRLLQGICFLTSLVTRSDFIMSFSHH